MYVLLSYSNLFLEHIDSRFSSFKYSWNTVEEQLKSEWSLFKKGKSETLCSSKKQLEYSEAHILEPRYSLLTALHRALSCAFVFYCTPPVFHPYSNFFFQYMESRFSPLGYLIPE
jgi:hypothetical protein